jgi:hypothetical protein
MTCCVEQIQEELKNVMTYEEAKELKELVKDSYPRGCWLTEEGGTGRWFIDALEYDGTPVKIGCGDTVTKIGPGLFRIKLPGAEGDLSKAGLSVLKDGAA